MSSSLPAPPPPLRKWSATAPTSRPPPTTNNNVNNANTNKSGAMSGSSLDMWAIDRSDIRPHQSLRGQQRYQHQSSNYLEEEDIGVSSWGGRAAATNQRGGNSSSFNQHQYDGFVMDPVPMPPTPTDFPPPPPSNLVRSMSTKGSTATRVAQRDGSTRNKRTTGTTIRPSTATSSKVRDDNTQGDDANDFQGLLLSYKKYVDSRILPRLTEALETLAVTESKIETISAELEIANNDRTTLRGSVQQLRSLLDQERVATAAENSQTRSLLSRQMEAERSQLQAKLKDVECAAQQHAGSSRKLAELERTLELREMEIRTLKQQQQPKRDDNDTRGGGGGDGLNAAESMDRFVAEIEVLVGEAIAFGRAFGESSDSAGLGIEYSPSVVWGAVTEAVGLNGCSGMDLARMEGSISAIRKAIKTERACVSMSLGQLAAGHAELLESIGNREHEMWRVKDMHQQRLEDLERDFNEQLQNLNAQLQYQTQYGSASVGVGGGHGYSASSPQQQSPRAGGTNHAAFSDLSPLTTGGGGSPRYHQQSSPDYTDDGGSLTTRTTVVSTASQTKLELSLLFPPGSTSSLASSPATGGPRATNGTKGVMPPPPASLLLDRTVVDASDLMGMVGAAGGGQQQASLNRVISELNLLQDENIHLKEEVRRLKDERHKYLGFMRMGSEGVSSSLAGFGTNHHRIDVGSTMLQRSSLVGGSSTGLLLS